VSKASIDKEAKSECIFSDMYQNVRVKNTNLLIDYEITPSFCTHFEKLRKVISIMKHDISAKIAPKITTCASLISYM